MQITEVTIHPTNDGFFATNSMGAKRITRVNVLRTYSLLEQPTLVLLCNPVVFMLTTLS